MPTGLALPTACAKAIAVAHPATKAMQAGYDCAVESASEGSTLDLRTPSVAGFRDF